MSKRKKKRKDIPWCALFIQTVKPESALSELQTSSKIWDSIYAGLPEKERNSKMGKAVRLHLNELSFNINILNSGIQFYKSQTARK